MAAFVGVPTIGAVRSGNGFRFTVSYTIRYSQEELNFAEGFADDVELLESDRGEPFGGADDRYPINPPVTTFRPRATVETRSWTFHLTDDQLDTESGGEEVYAVVHFRRNIQGLPAMTRNTPIFPVSRP